MIARRHRHGREREGQGENSMGEFDEAAPAPQGGKKRRAAAGRRGQGRVAALVPLAAGPALQLHS